MYRVSRYSTTFEGDYTIRRQNYEAYSFRNRLTLWRKVRLRLRLMRPVDDQRTELTECRAQLV